MEDKIKQLLEELEKTHNKYLEVIREGFKDDPEDTEMQIQASKERFENLKNDLKNFRLEEEAIRDSIKMIEEGIQEAVKDIQDSPSKRVFLKGLCSRGCLEQFMRSFVHGVVASLSNQTADRKVKEVSAELCTQEAVNTIMFMLAEAQSNKSVNETRKAVHDKINSATDIIEGVSKAVADGRVLTMNLSSKKEEMN